MFYFKIFNNMAESDEKKDPTELSIGKIVAWVVGGLTLLGGVAAPLEGKIAAGVLYIVAGAFGLPPTREMIENELGIKMSRWLVVLIYLILIVIAGGMYAGAAAA